MAILAPPKILPVSKTMPALSGSLPDERIANLVRRAILLPPKKTDALRAPQKRFWGLALVLVWVKNEKRCGICVFRSVVSLCLWKIIADAS